MTDSEFAYTDADFNRVRRLVHDHAGISLAESKRSMVYNRLARRLRERGLTSFYDYLELVESDAAEWEACLNSLTTNLTSFFREPHHFDILAAYVKRRHLPKLRIWCAASSTGEEPYSIAMTMVEAYNTDKPPVEIIASDIDTNVLAHAQCGVYDLERLDKVSERRRSRFFQRGDGPNAGLARVRPMLRTMIDYRRVNLQDPNWKIPGDLDVIICRNVLIYFAKPAQTKILERFASLLAADGLLITGHSENIAHTSGLFTALGQTVYRPKVAAPLMTDRATSRS